MSQDSNTILQGQLKQQYGLYTTRPQYTNILYGTVVQTDVSIKPILPSGAASPIPSGMMTVAVAALGSNYVTAPILYPGYVAPPRGAIVAVGFTPNGTPICVTVYPSPNSPPASAVFAAAISAGVHNTLSYDILVTGAINYTAAVAGATVTLGVGPTTTPTQQTLATINAALAQVLPFSAVVPAGYYLALGTTGTVTIGTINAIGTPL